LEENDKNIGSIKSNNIEFLLTNNAPDYYKYSFNPVIKEDIEENIFFPKNDEKSLVDGEEFLYFRTLEKSNEIEKFKNKNKNDIISDPSNYSAGKSYKEMIQLKIKEKIYLKKPFKEKKNLGRKKKSFEDMGEHNKFSDDNIIRKCKHVILNSVLHFINKKIKMLYPELNKKLFKERKLFKLKQNHLISSKTSYNKCFLNKTLKSIFSEDISPKYTKYSPSHNKDVIDSLINEKDEIKKSQFNAIFNLTFVDCLKHFRGSDVIEELKGLNQLNDYISEIKMDNNHEEYCNLLKIFINNFEKIVMEKKARKKKKIKNL